jgi:transcription antitermination factor NusG
LITLPDRAGLKTGDRVRILRGPFADRLAIFHDTKPRERVEILLMLLGSEQRTVLPRADIEPVP